jgi:hypothetical protein
VWHRTRDVVRRLARKLVASSEDKIAVLATLALTLAVNLVTTLWIWSSDEDFEVGDDVVCLLIGALSAYWAYTLWGFSASSRAWSRIADSEADIVTLAQKRSRFVRAEMEKKSVRNAVRRLRICIWLIAPVLCACLVLGLRGR